MADEWQVWCRVCEAMHAYPACRPDRNSMPVVPIGKEAG